MTDFVSGLAVIPVVVAPLQALLPVILAVLVAIGGAILSVLKPATMAAIGKFLWRKKLGVLIFIGAVTGMVYGASYLFSTNAGVTEAVGGSDWTAYRGGPARTGAVTGAPDPDAPANIWTFAGEVATFYSSPAVVGNRVYVCSADKGLFKDRGAIYCLDADTGGVVWKYSPGDFRATYSSPSVAEGHVVSGEGLHFTRDARITCLTADTGAMVWEHRTASHVESSPCIHDGRVYIGAGDDGLYCIALKPKAGGEANVLWHVGGDKYPDCETSPIVHEGKVFFGLGEGGHAIVCVDAATGKELWKRPTRYPVFSSPAIADGKVVVGMGNGNLIQSAEQLRDLEIKRLRESGAGEAEIAKAREELAPAGAVWCLDAATGQVEWTFKADRNIMGAIAAVDGRLYFGTRGGMVHCLAMDGKPVGKAWDAHDPVNTSLAVGASHVYVMTGSGRLFALDRRTLRPKWEMGVATGGANFVSSPAVARGHVYVGTDADGLVCVGRAGEAKTVETWAGALGGPGESGWVDGSRLPKSGKRGWRYPTEDAAAATAPPVWLGGAVYASVQGTGSTGLAKLVSAETGRRGGPDVEAKWFLPTPNPIAISPVARGSRLYAVDGKAGDTGRQLRAVDVATGQVVWRRPVAEAATGEVLLAEDRLYVFDGPATLTCLALGDAKTAPDAHSVVWRTTTGAAVGAPAYFQDKIFHAAASPGGLVALDAGTGLKLWRSELTEPVTGPVVGAGKIAVGTAAGLVVARVVDGSTAWVKECGRVLAPLVGDEARLACSTASGLYVFDREGKLLRHRPEALPGVPPLLAGDSAVYAAAGSLERVLLIGPEDKAGPTRWMRLAESIYGPVTTGPILVKSNLYFGTGKRGLVCGRPRK